MASVALTLFSGMALTGCSSSDDDANKCCRQIGRHDSGTNDAGTTDNSSAGIMAAEEGEFSIMPVEDPIVIDDQNTGGLEDGSNSLKELWLQHLDEDQGSGD